MVERGCALATAFATNVATSKGGGAQKGPVTGDVEDRPTLWFWRGNLFKYLLPTPWRQVTDINGNVLHIPKMTGRAARRHERTQRDDNAALTVSGATSFERCTNTVRTGVRYD